MAAAGALTASLCNDFNTTIVKHCKIYEINYRIPVKINPAAPIRHIAVHLKPMRCKNSKAVEIVADYSGRAAKRPEQPERTEILEMLKRRPCTKMDICEATGLDGADVDRLLNELERSSLIRETMHDGRKYFQAGKRR